MHLIHDHNTGPAEEISFSDFLKVDIRIGEIIEVSPFPEARNPAYKLRVDFGEGVGIKKTSAQITQNYGPEELMGKKIAAVVNFPPKQIGKMISEVLLLGFSDTDQNVVLFELDKQVPNGSRLH